MRGNSRHTSRKRLRFGIVFTVVVLLVGFFFPKIISGISFVVLYPVHAVSVWYQTSESSVPKYLRVKSDLVKEIESLKKQIANENGTQLSIRRLLEENMQLRAATNFGTTTNRLTARVMAQPSRLAYDLLQIDKGLVDGITVGSPVFIGFDTVIGVVVHATANYSFVELITTPGFESTSYVVGPNVFATLEGVGGGVARVRVPQGIPLKEGNLVLLPSIDSGVYGEIISVENPPTQPVQYGYVTPPVSLQGILYVSVALDDIAPRTVEEINNEVREVSRNYFKLDNVPVFDIESLLSTSTPTSTASSSSPE
ncbi:MAG: rod shape-determining protein MreC [Candidatus Paceibacterota bacterium]